MTIKSNPQAVGCRTWDCISDHLEAGRLAPIDFRPKGGGYGWIGGFTGKRVLLTPPEEVDASLEWKVMNALDEVLPIGVSQHVYRSVEWFEGTITYRAGRAPFVLDGTARFSEEIDGSSESTISVSGYLIVYTTEIDSHVSLDPSDYTMPGPGEDPTTPGPQVTDSKTIVGSMFLPVTASGPYCADSKPGFGNGPSIIWMDNE